VKTRQKIIALLQQHGQMTIHDLSATTGFSRQYLHRKINELEEDGVVKALGMPPRVFYSLAEEKTERQHNEIKYEDEQFLMEHFLLVDSLGNLLDGIDALQYWCEKQNLKPEKTLPEFIATRKKYMAFYNEQHLIDGTEKLKATKGINQVGVDSLFYLDFYAIERFGKTRLGTLMHYAKQGQNKSLMKKIADEIRQRIYNLILRMEVDAVLFVPPTIDRKIQIMTVLEKLLAIDKPKIKVQKIKNTIVVPQKALSNIFERVANAKNTFYLPEQKAYRRVLMIDDAVGSGATMNEIALRMKEKKVAKEVIGIAITGSYKGFEVISEL
jgi:DNA-binding transcriptional ArsR family regulator